MIDIIPANNVKKVSQPMDFKRCEIFQSDENPLLAKFSVESINDAEEKNEVSNLVKTFFLYLLWYIR